LMIGKTRRIAKVVTRRTALLVAVLFVGFGINAFDLMAIVGQASAAGGAGLSNMSPNPADMLSDPDFCRTPDNPNGFPGNCPYQNPAQNQADGRGASGHILKYEQTSDITELDMAAYYKGGAPAGGDSIHINWTFGNSPSKIECALQRSGGNYDIPMVTMSYKQGGNTYYQKYRINTENNYSQPSQNSGCDPHDPSRYNKENCYVNQGDPNCDTSKNQFASDYPIPDGFKNGASGPYRYDELDISICLNSKLVSGAFQCTTPVVKDKQRMVFSVASLDSTAKMGVLQAKGPHNNYSTVGQTYDPDQTATGGAKQGLGYGINYQYEFGIPCGLQNPGPQTINLYDPDPSKFGVIQARVLRDGAPVAQGDYVNLSHMSWSPGNRYLYVQAGGESGETASFQLKNLGPNHRYELQIIDTQVDNPPGGLAAVPPYWPSVNVISVGLPQDSIWGDVDCSGQATCSINGVPPFVDPNTKFNVHMTARVDGAVANDPKFGLSLDSGASQTKAGIPDGGNNFHADYTEGPVNLGPHLLSGTFSYTDASGKLNTVDCQDLFFTAANRPYFGVYGGDTEAGQYVYTKDSSGDQACQQEDSGYVGWNDDAGSYDGAGSEIAAFASGKLRSFATGQNTTGGNNPQPPFGLTFANTSDVLQLGNASYGGQFGSNLPGMPQGCDFGTDDRSGDPVSDLKDGKTIGVGATAAYYSKGQDVYIGGDVTYAGSGSWGSINDVPSLRLVVVGANIYVGSNVKELDGLYVAEPGPNGVGGNIYTCSMLGVGGKPKPVDPNDSDFFDVCGAKHLQVFGSFVAKHVELNRAAGTLSQAGGGWQTSAAAEQYIYGPEMWLPRIGGTASLKYASVTGLPPVL
jgi:hypothetical protein